MPSRHGFETEHDRTALFAEWQRLASEHDAVARNILTDYANAQGAETNWAEYVWNWPGSPQWRLKGTFRSGDRLRTLVRLELVQSDAGQFYWYVDLAYRERE